MTDEFTNWKTEQTINELDEYEMEAAIAEAEKLDKARMIKVQRDMQRSSAYWRQDEANKIMKEQNLSPTEQAEFANFFYRNPQALEKVQRKTARKELETAMRQFKKAKGQTGQSEQQPQAGQQPQRQPKGQQVPQVQGRQDVNGLMQTVKKEVGQGRVLSDQEQIDLLDMFLKS